MVLCTPRADSMAQGTNKPLRMAPADLRVTGQSSPDPVNGHPETISPSESAGWRRVLPRRGGAIIILYRKTIFIYQAGPL